MRLYARIAWFSAVFSVTYLLMAAPPAARAQTLWQKLTHQAPCDCCCPAMTPTADAAPVESKKPEAPSTSPSTQAPATDMSSLDSPADSGSETVSLFDSCVGYIDDAIPTSQVRLRVDAARRNNRPTRAEFFYARGGPLGPGLPDPEASVDYQEITSYVEGALTPRFSIFFEAPVRFLHPEINPDHAGFGDLDAGFKYAFIYEKDLVTSFQLRAWAPTGDPSRGLGNDHASLEPALLCYKSLSPCLRVESELRYWIPLGGTSFAGDILRYGVGVSCGRRYPDHLWMNPVVEVVGWTVLDGKESAVPPIPPIISDAAGDTIVNLKVGMRFGCSEHLDFYAGYGRALTGAVWYTDIWRFEVRWQF